MTLAYPSIWTPRRESRFGPWWRRPWRHLSTFMADHLKYGSGNHLLYGPGGHLVWECGGGPIGGGTCTNCDPAPIRFSVTLSDISEPTGTCFSCSDPPSGFVSELVASVNGTYTLENTAACQWTYTNATVYRNIWNNYDECQTLDPLEDKTPGITITLNYGVLFGTGTWSIRVQFDFNPGDSFFTDDVSAAASTNCQGPHSFTNELTDCQPTEAWGGSAVATAMA